MSTRLALLLCTIILLLTLNLCLAPIVEHEPLLPSATHTEPPKTPLDAERLRGLLGFAPPKPLVSEATALSAPAVAVLGTLRAELTQGLALASLDGKTQTLWEGQVVDGWTVAHVGHRCLELEREGHVVSRCMSEVQPKVLSAVAPPLVLGAQVFSRAEVMKLVETLGPLVMTTTRAVPLVKDGMLQGMSLQFGNDSPLRRFGLEPRDVITRINGRPFEIAEAARLFSAWQAQQSLQVGVLRDGKEVVLTFAIR